MELTKERYIGVDALRGLMSIIIAYVYHYGIVFGVRPFVNHGFAFFYDYAWLGVETFFSISGFMMYIVYEKKIRNSEITIETFLLKRVIKLYPLMILTTCIAALGQWTGYIILGKFPCLDIGDTRNTFYAFILNILGLQSGWFSNFDSTSINGPTWYISILFVCYIVFFIIIKISKNKKNEVIFIIALAILGLQLINYPLNFPLLYWSSGRGYLSFSTGVLLAVFSSVNKINKKHILSITIIIILTLYMIKINLVGNIFPIVGLIISPSFLYIVLYSNFINKIAKLKVLKYMGKISLSVYLWNIPLYILINLINQTLKLNIDYSKKLTYILINSIALLISIFSYELFEKPIYKLLKIKH